MYPAKIAPNIEKNHCGALKPIMATHSLTFKPNCNILILKIR